MPNRKSVIFGIALTLFMDPSIQVQAAPCRLLRVTELDVGGSARGPLTVPVTIAGHAYTFALDLDSSFSWVRSDVADAQHLQAKWLPGRITLRVNDVKTRKEVVLKDFNLGIVQVSHFPVAKVAPENKHGIDGAVGLDLLSRFDIDVDLKAHKVTLFSQDHCPGAVVYWTDAYAVLPFDEDPSGHPYFTAQLDDRTVIMSFNPALPGGMMGMSDARDAFGIEKDDPRLTPIKSNENDAPETAENRRYFRYRFHKLTLGDLIVNNPVVVLFPQTQDQKCRPNTMHVPPGAWAVDLSHHCYGASRLMLGRAEMRHLHLYYAFKERKLYISTADAPARSAAVPYK